MLLLFFTFHIVIIITIHIVTIISAISYLITSIENCYDI